MKNLSLENLNTDVENLILTANDSYIETYPEFIRYFKDIELIENHHLVIASHFVYGWMPTVLHLETDEIGEVILYLNAAKFGNLLDEERLEVIKRCVNNSMVGTSKLLHFINPKIYAIWDSRIYRYLTGNKYSYGIDKPQAYLKYLSGLRDISAHADYQNFHSKIQRNFEYEISPMRAIELLMFETDRERSRKK